MKNFMDFNRPARNSKITHIAILTLGAFLALKVSPSFWPTPHRSLASAPHSLLKDRAHWTLSEKSIPRGGTSSSRLFLDPSSGKLIVEKTYTSKPSEKEDSPAPERAHRVLEDATDDATPSMSGSGAVENHRRGETTDAEPDLDSSGSGSWATETRSPLETNGTGGMAGSHHYRDDIASPNRSGQMAASEPQYRRFKDLITQRELEDISREISEKDRFEFVEMVADPSDPTIAFHPYVELPTLSQYLDEVGPTSEQGIRAIELFQNRLLALKSRVTTHLASLKRTASISTDKLEAGTLKNPAGLWLFRSPEMTILLKSNNVVIDPQTLKMTVIDPY